MVETDLQRQFREAMEHALKAVSKSAPIKGKRPRPAPAAKLQSALAEFIGWVKGRTEKGISECRGLAVGLRKKLTGVFHV